MPHNNIIKERCFISGDLFYFCNASWKQFVSKTKSVVKFGLLLICTIPLLGWFLNSSFDQRSEKDVVKGKYRTKIIRRDNPEDG